MNLEEHKRLLQHFTELVTDADLDTSASARVFLPLPRHRLALRSETMIVLGARGAGKTTLFRIAKELGPRLRELCQDQQIPRASWVDCFNKTLEHPEAMVLDALSVQFPNDTALRAFWLTHLLGRMVDAGVPGARLPDEFARLRTGQESAPATWTAWAESNPAALIGALDAIERALAERKEMVFAAYDALDAIGCLGFSDRSHRQRLVRTLLALWLSLSSRYRHLRAKIFLRHDLFEDAESDFADVSKLRARSVVLDWDVESLYRLVVRHLANHGSACESARNWLGGIKGLTLEEQGDFGLMPGNMDDPVIKEFASAIAGEVMGTGVKKGYTHRWIADRLQDAEGRIVPRSMLWLLSEAARHALQEPRSAGHQLMKPTDLVEALAETSRRRAAELAEEYAVVRRLERLRGTTMLLERDQVVQLLAEPVDDQDPLPSDGERAFDELRRIGVLEVRADGRVDVPDIYRYGYGIKRKGGARRPQ